MFSLDCPSCAKWPLYKLEVRPVVDVICNQAVILCCSICLLWGVTVCGWRLLISLSSQVWGNPVQECCFTAVRVSQGSCCWCCTVRAVLQLPGADLHHWSRCWCDGRKLHILVLMFSGSFETWSLLDPAPREILCPGMVGRIFGPNLVNCSHNSLVCSFHCIHCTGNSLV